MTFLLMCLASYRLTRLITKDTFPPVLWLRDRLAGGWREATEKDKERPVQEIDGVPNVYVYRKSWSPYWLAELMTCPWCASGWVSLGVTVAVAHGMPITSLILWWLGTWAVSSVVAAQEWA